MTTLPPHNLPTLFSDFGRRLFAKITEHTAAGECDEWCEEAMELATKLGLARQETYDPELHGSIDAEPGSSLIWTWRHLPAGWRTDKPAAEFINPATGEPQTDLSERGVLGIHNVKTVATEGAAMRSDETAQPSSQK